jgi:DNA-binding NtrC family response regulator
MTSSKALGRKLLDLLSPLRYAKEEEKKPIRVLIAEDDSALCQLWIRLLAEDFEVVTSSTLSQSLLHLHNDEESFDILIVDLMLDGGIVSADSLIDEWVRRPGSNPLCVISGKLSDIDAANDYFLRGAFNVFPKPSNLLAIRELTYKYKHHVELQRDRDYLRRKLARLQESYDRLARLNLLLFIGVVLSLLGVDEPIRQALIWAFTSLIGISP